MYFFFLLDFHGFPITSQNVEKKFARVSPRPMGPKKMWKIWFCRQCTFSSGFPWASHHFPKRQKKNARVSPRPIGPKKLWRTWFCRQCTFSFRPVFLFLFAVFLICFSFGWPNLQIQTPKSPGKPTCTFRQGCRFNNSNNFFLQIPQALQKSKLQKQKIIQTPNQKVQNPKS